MGRILVHFLAFHDIQNVTCFFCFHVQAEPQKKLEDFENAAFQTLVAKQKNQAKPKCKAKGQPKAKVMKKPSAASNGVTKTVTKPSAKGAEARANCYGCVRCRGVTHGCPTCIQPNFGGTILNGRAAWKAYMAAKGKPCK